MADNEEAVKEEPKSAEEIASSTLPTEASSEPAPQDNEAWASMRAENKALKDQLEAREELTTPYEPPSRQYVPPQPTYQPQQSTNWGQQQVDPGLYTDPITGEFKQVEYTQAVNRAIQASQVNATANAQSFAQNLVKEEVDWAVARMKHPELDNNQELAEDVWGQYFIERQRDPNVSPLAVTEKVKAKWDRLAKREEKAIDKQAEKAIAEKEVATSDTSANAPSVGKNQEIEEEEDDDEELRAKTRGVIGNAFSGTKVSREEQELAIVERLKKKSWAKPLEEETT